MQIVINTQKAIYAALSTGLGIDVYDFVPEDAPLPYITIGNSKLTYIPVLGKNLHEIIFTIHTYAACTGRKELLEIADDIFGLLNNMPLNIADYTHYETRLVTQYIDLVDEGAKYALDAEYRVTVG